MKIILCVPADKRQQWLDALRAQFPRATIWAWLPEPAHAAAAGAAPAAPVAQAADADYALVWAPPAALFDAQRRLKAVFNLGAGVDGIMQLANLPRDIPVIRLNDAGMAVQMAEYVCHALIRHTRAFAAYDQQAAKREWQARAAIDRAAWPVGVMGLGAIGARVAQAIAGFDYPTFGWARTRSTLSGISCFAGMDQLDQFLRSVRVLICLLPLTAETAGILNRNTLSALKPGGYLINAARGRHLVEADLLELLASGALSGATLDVAAEEPLPPDHPFWRQPNITITPHIAAITLVPDSAAQIAQKIHALERGEAIEGVVAPGQGY